MKTEAIENLTEAQWHELYERFLPEMPYGVAKARTGDPYTWLAERLEAMDSSNDPLPSTHWNPNAPTFDEWLKEQEEEEETCPHGVFLGYCAECGREYGRVGV